MNRRQMLLMCVPLLAACAAEPPRTIGDNRKTTFVLWSAAEEQQAVAIREVRRTAEASHHAVRLLRGEQPHSHEKSDLTIFAVRGEVAMHIGDRTVMMQPGDVAFVPRGVPHWAANRNGLYASEAYVVFTPPLDPQDRKPVR